MELIDLRHARDLVRIVAVMRERMVRIGNTDLWVGAIAGFAGELERDDPGDVTLQRQHLQVEHQSRVIGIGRRHAHGPVQIRQRIIRGVSLGLLNAALDLAHGVKILADPRAVTRPELSVETRDVFIEPIEEAGPFPQRSLSVRNAAAFAEKAFENNSRMCLGGQGRCRRRP